MIQFQNNYLTVFQSSLYMTTTAIIETNDVVVMTDRIGCRMKLKRLKIIYPPILAINNCILFIPIVTLTILSVREHFQKPRQSHLKNLQIIRIKKKFFKRSINLTSVIT